MPPGGSVVPPSSVAAVVGELSPTDPAAWLPASYDEWEAKRKTETVLGTWSDQMTHERRLRSIAAVSIFGLIVIQVIGVFALLVAQGLGRLHLDAGLLQIVVPSIFGEVFGLGFLVTKYLFNQALRHGLDSLIQGLRHGN
jgi:hypothetical protein